MNQDNPNETSGNSFDLTDKVQTDDAVMEENNNGQVSGQELNQWNDDTQYQKLEDTKQSNMSLASMIMGIIGIVTSCCCGGIIFGSLGVLFALLSRTEDKFEKYAKIGLITSIIAFVLTVLSGVIWCMIIIIGGNY